ncbi:TIM barrel protein [Paracoccus caeni]|uniref:TIM barrel protein n=1 Tax=Paracoccus caeni TaxID=657651 RepID=A0A934VYA2_9RHOB|nr:TIM barrel protein [Paracoccus caeni]MBK4215777.1 TIM barrel protein [Paracoccus caeni]
MPRFAANLTTMFTELPLLDRFSAAADAGFQGIEILYPYDIAARELHLAAAAAGLQMVLLNCPPPNWSGGPRGFAAQPGMETRFRTDFDRALRFAQALRARHIHVMTGKTDSPDAQRVLVENLRWACERAPHASLTIKPGSRSGPRGFPVTDYDMAADIVEQVGMLNLGLQLDTYLAQQIEGDALQTWRRHATLIRHVQIASYPDRDEPQPGKMNFPAFYDELDEWGYKGWISAFYDPARRTDAGLGWLPRT